MAKQTITKLIDDLDGKDADETVTYALDGVTYEIDLSTKNADKFRGLFQDYIAVSSKVKGATKAKKATTGPSAAEVRAWAQSNGHPVPDRGRIPQNVIDAYNANN